jgi:HPt (histidine-containing phosphotransfer) domain-containing protein
MTRAFDRAELLETVDNDWEFLGDTVQMLAADGPALLGEIRRFGDAGDAQSVGKAAHTLKGMISNFCAPEAQASALAVEQIAKSSDLSSLPSALQTLEAQVRSLVSDLTEFLATRV